MLAYGSVFIIYWSKHPGARRRGKSVNASHSHYEVLQVARNASPEVIRAAYRSLAQRHHPDRQSGTREATEETSRLNVAYAVLSDPERRAQYDAWLGHQSPAPSCSEEPPAAPSQSRVFTEPKPTKVVLRELAHLFLGFAVVLGLLGIMAWGVQIGPTAPIGYLMALMSGGYLTWRLLTKPGVEDLPPAVGRRLPNISGQTIYLLVVLAVALLFGLTIYWAKKSWQSDSGRIMVLLFSATVIFTFLRFYLKRVRRFWSAGNEEMASEAAIVLVAFTWGWVPSLFEGNTPHRNAGFILMWGLIYLSWFHVTRRFLPDRRAIDLSWRELYGSLLLVSAAPYMAFFFSGSTNSPRFLFRTILQADEPKIFIFLRFLGAIVGCALSVAVGAFILMTLGLILAFLTKLIFRTWKTKGIRLRTSSLVFGHLVVPAFLFMVLIDRILSSFV